MLIDLSPLRLYRNFRLLYTGQVVSFLGSMVSYVAIPYQIYELTKSSLTVGMLGAVQLFPVLVFGLIGGTLADRWDRKKLLLYSEMVMCACAIFLAIHAAIPNPQVEIIFILAFILQTANACHRPSMEALNQKIVSPEHYASLGALGSFKHSVGAIIGPSIGGVLLSHGGLQLAYWFDVLTFTIAIFCISLLKLENSLEGHHSPSSAPSTPLQSSPLASMKEGLIFAYQRPQLLGTYLVDIVAMTFAFPMALFPAMAKTWGGAHIAGQLYSAMSIGALGMTMMSGWAKKIPRQGMMVVLAAAFWGVAIIFFGFAPTPTLALVALIFAGAFDMLSGLYRGVIWNQTIPNHMRGRLAGLEMMSYMSGPLIGNFRAGWMAESWNIQLSIIYGGILCVLGVILCAWWLPSFWFYRPINSLQAPAQ